MRRRTILSATATAATVAIAGCSGGGGNDESADTEPTEPIDSSAEELVFSLDDFDGTGWSKANEEISGNMAERQFVSRDGGITQIYATVWYYENASEAENKYQELNTDVTEDTSTESRGMGTEAFAYNPPSGAAAVVFRDVNVVAKVEHYGAVSGSVDTATEYANRLQNKWRS